MFLSHFLSRFVPLYKRVLNHSFNRKGFEQAKAAKANLRHDAKTTLSLPMIQL